MLAKLMKYELKATGRVFLPLYIALLVLAIINRFMVNLPTSWKIPAVISLIIYAVILVGMFVIALVMTIQRFNKNLLTVEGYLMFTLPVKPWQHIVSKLLVAMFWVVVSTAITFISGFIIAYRAKNMAMIIKDINTLLLWLSDRWTSSFFVYFVEFLIGVLVILAAMILLLYASIAIGHLFSRHRILASIAAFIVLNTLTEILNAIVTMIAGRFYHGFAFMRTLQFDNHLIIWANILLAAVFGAIFFAISNRILNRHLNLD